MSVQEKKSYILQELRKNGCGSPIRDAAVDIILQDECCCCKEIYYQAIKKDPTIGMATVYRMVKTLEETGLIKRKNLYRIQVEEESA